MNSIRGMCCSLYFALTRFEGVGIGRRLASQNAAVETNTLHAIHDALTPLVVLPSFIYDYSQHSLVLQLLVLWCPGDPMDLSFEGLIMTRLYNTTIMIRPFESSRLIVLFHLLRSPPLEAALASLRTRKVRVVVFVQRYARFNRLVLLFHSRF